MNNKLQEKILHFQILENKIKQIRQKEQNVLMQINELERTKESLDQIKESDSMIPIGAGVFVPAKITDSKHVLIGIGSGTAIKKTADECKEILNGFSSFTFSNKLILGISNISDIDCFNVL